jgi:hypothetical protein
MSNTGKSLSAVGPDGQRLASGLLSGVLKPGGHQVVVLSLYFFPIPGNSGLSMRRIATLYGVSMQAVSNWIRTFAKEHYEKPAPEGKAVILELDELWHYVKKNATNSGSGKRWILVQVDCRGGPMFWADFSIGLKALRDRMLDYPKKLGGDHWKPAALLNQLADEGKTFTGYVSTLSYEGLYGRRTLPDPLGRSV